METYDFGMASIVKRTLKDGSSAYLVRYRMVDGGQRSRQFDRRRDADAFAAKVRGDLARWSAAVKLANIKE